MNPPRLSVQGILVYPLKVYHHREAPGSGPVRGLLRGPQRGDANNTPDK